MQTAARVLHITGADEHRRAIERAKTTHAFASLARRYHSAAKASTRTLTESFFWLGATVARACAVSKHGDGALNAIQRHTAISRGVLHYARGFYDSFGGDFDEMYAWVSSWIGHYDEVLMKDIRQLVKLNKDRQHLSRLIAMHNSARRGERVLSKHHRGQIKEAGLPQPEESGTDLSFESESVTVPPLKAHRSTGTPPRQGEKWRLKLQRRLGEAVAQMYREELTAFTVREVAMPSGEVVTLRIEIIR